MTSLLATDALPAVKAAAASLQQSVRNVQITYKKHMGYSVNSLARFQRFIKATEIIAEAAAHTPTKELWFEIIETLGYHDQSQLIHDFKYFLAITPMAYLQLQQYYCKVT